jgi:hypothetical protein
VTFGDTRAIALTEGYSDTNEHLFSRVLFAALTRVPIVNGFRPIFGDRFSFSGLVAGIEVKRAFQLFTGLLYVGIFIIVIIVVVTVDHSALHRTQGNNSADDRFLSD